MIRELMIPVEQVVRPLPCGHTRKMQMREELYSLLEDRYHDLCRRAGITPDNEHPQPVFLQQAIAAFGNPDEIREQLLTTIPRHVRWSKQLDLWLLGNVEQPTLAGAARIGMFVTAMLGLTLLLTIGVTCLLGEGHKSLLIWPVLAALPILSGINATGQLWLGLRAANASRSGRYVEFAWHTLAAMLLFSTTIVLLYQIASPTFLATTGWRHLQLTLPLTTTLFATVCLLAGRERAQRQPWLDLELGSSNN